MRSVLALVLLLVGVSAVLAACPSGSKRWSQDYASVTEGSSVQISGHVRLDVSTVRLDVLTIPNGAGLYFDEGTQESVLRLIANEINIQTGGQLYVGCESRSFSKQAEIVLHGSKTGSSGAAGFGRKALVVYENATFEIHGRKDSETWTRLDRNVEWNYRTRMADDNLVLEKNPGWGAGDTIVVASTDYDSRLQTEVATVSRTSGSRVELTGSLRYPHYGRSWNSAYNKDFIPMRAEVGKLNSNVRIYGNVLSGGDADYGGQVVVAGQSRVFISGVEMYNMGQASRDNAFPIYFVKGNHANSRVSHNRIRNSMKGCIVLSEVQNLNVHDNLCLNISGNAYTIQGGLSYNNVFSHNLGIVSYNDTHQYVFFSAGPQNEFVDNAACGNGFRFSFTNAANQRDPTRWPRYTPIKKFERNVAHSCESHCLVVESSDPRRFSLSNEFVQGKSISDLESYLSNRPFLPHDLSDNIIYRSRQYGAYLNGRSIRFLRNRIADCSNALILLSEGTLVENLVVNGETENFGFPIRPTYEQGRSRPWPYNLVSPVYGIKIADCCGPFWFSDVRLHNFNDYTFEWNPQVRPAAALTVNEGTNIVPTNVKFYNVQFFNVTNRFFFPNQFGDRESLSQASITDVDGSLTGVCGATVVRDNAHVSRGCEARNAWNAFVCPPGANFRQFNIMDLDATGFNDTVDTLATEHRGYLWRLSDKNLYRSPAATDGGAYTEDGQQRQRFRLNFDANLLSNQDYVFRFGQTRANTPNRVRLTMQYGGASTHVQKEEEFIRVAIPYPLSTKQVNISISSDVTMSEVSSKAQLKLGTYFRDTPNDLIWVYLASRSNVYSYYFSDTQANSNNEGVAFLRNRVQLDITASCEGGCSVAKNADQLASSLPATTAHSAPNAFFNNCEQSGNYAQSAVRLSNKRSEQVVFGDDFAVTWRSWSSNFNVSSRLASSGAQSQSELVPFALDSPCLVFWWGNWGRTTFFFSNNITVSGQTHLTMKVRSRPARSGSENPLTSTGPINLMISLWSSDTQVYRSNVPLVSPWYVSGNRPVSDDKWYEVAVPLYDLGVNDGDKIYKMDIGNDQGRSVVAYIDDLALSAFSHQLSAVQAAPTTAGGSATSWSPSRGSSQTPGNNGGSGGGGGGGLSTTAIIIIVVVVVVVVLVLAAAVVLFIFKKDAVMSKIKPSRSYDTSRATWGAEQL